MRRTKQPFAASVLSATTTCDIHVIMSALPRELSSARQHVSISRQCETENKTSIHEHTTRHLAVLASREAHDT